MNGLVTWYLNDPIGPANALGEFDIGGNTIAHFTYGLGLTSQIIGGNSYSSDFDARGNVVGFTNSTGQYSNRYSHFSFWAGSLVSSSRLDTTPVRREIRSFD
jgi:hypothetical protein